MAGLLTALPLVARALLWLAAGAVVGLATMLLTAFLLEAETPVVFCIVGGALAGLLFVGLPVATPGGAALPAVDMHHVAHRRRRSPRILGVAPVKPRRGKPRKRRSYIPTRTSRIVHVRR